MKLAWFVIALAVAGAPLQGQAQLSPFDDINQQLATTCAAGNCVIQLECGAAELNTPTIPPLPHQVLTRVPINNKHGVVIQGCGMDATTLSMAAYPVQGMSYIYMFEVFGGSSGITFRDLTLSLTVDCEGGCRTYGVVDGQVVETAGSVSAIVQIQSGSEDVRFERVRFKSTRKNDNYPAYPAGINTDAGGGEIPESVYVSDSQFETSGGGVLLNACDDCWIEGSTFQDAEPASPVDNRRSFVFVKKSKGEGVRIANNTFNMHTTRQAPVAFNGVLLWVVSGSEAGEGAQVVGNTFENVQDSVLADRSLPLTFYGYNAATVSGNRFKCDPALASCKTWAISTELSGTCSSSMPCNRRNVISNNVFTGFYQEGAGDGDYCPIIFNSKGEPTESRENLVFGNMFRLSPSGTGLLGVCGDQKNFNAYQDNERDYY